MNPSMLSKRTLHGLPKTVHGGQAWKIGGIEDYSHNLNPFGPPDDIKDIISSSVEGIDHYPDDNSTELKEAISERFRVPVEDIIIGSGSSDIIRMFPNTFIEDGDGVIIPNPSFAEYTHQCRIVGADVITQELSSEDDFRMDFDLLKSRIDDSVKAVYICNPNNPTGRIESRERILDLIEYCGDKGTFVFLDETLLELVPDHERISCIRYVDRYPNLIVAGSLTKSFAIPGIRIGFGFSNPDVIDELNKVRMTWNVGQIEQKVATELIRNRMGHVEKAARLMASEARWMHDRLTDIGLPIRMTDSYFFFDSVRPVGMDGHQFVERMLKGNIMVRDCASFGERFRDNVRFCVKDRERNERFVEAVREALR